MRKSILISSGSLALAIAANICQAQQVNPFASKPSSTPEPGLRVDPIGNGIVGGGAAGAIAGFLRGGLAEVISGAAIGAVRSARNGSAVQGIKEVVKSTKASAPNAPPRTERESREGRDDRRATEQKTRDIEKAERLSRTG